jgi:SagB-type dehydrogenase family enzyme
MGIAASFSMRTLLCVLLLVGVAWPSLANAKEPVKIKLPAAKTTGTVSLEAALAARRSNRRLAPEALPIATVGQILWAGQGVTSKKGFRTAPSAGARYPLRVYVVLPTGLWSYQAKEHALVQRSPKDLRKDLWKDVFARPWLVDAPLMILIAADYRRTEAKYGKKARRFVHIEVGHAGQNILLQATAMGLHGVGVGAFHPVRVKETLGLPAPQELLYVLVLGNPP